MIAFLVILVGCLAGGIVYVSATYNLYPPDPGGYLSYSDNILVVVLIGIITAIVFFGFYRLLKVRAGNLVWLGGAALFTQVATYAIPLVVSPDWSGFVFILAIPLLSAIATFVLDKINSV